MSAKMSPHALSNYLRNGSDSELNRRRGIVALSLVASATMGVVALYQTGLIRRLSEPPLPIFDADRVDASDEAYSMFATPDSLLGLTNFATTAVLASVGGHDRASRRPWLALATTGKVLLDTAFAFRITVQQPLKFKAWCFWCLSAAVSVFVALPLIIPETRTAVRTLRSRHREAVLGA